MCTHTHTLILTLHGPAWSKNVLNMMSKPYWHRNIIWKIHEDFGVSFTCVELQPWVVYLLDGSGCPAHNLRCLLGSSDTTLASQEIRKQEEKLKLAEASQTVGPVYQISGFPQKEGERQGHNFLELP